MIETAITTIVLTIIALLVTSTLFESQAYSAAESKSYATNQAGRALLLRVSNELRAAVGDQIEPLAMDDSGYVQYQHVLAVNPDGTLELSQSMEFRFEMAVDEQPDMKDNNGDGRVDEGVVTWTDESGETVVVANNVLGMRLNRVGNAIEFAVDLGVVLADGHVFQKTFVQSVTPRN